MDTQTNPPVGSEAPSQSTDKVTGEMIGIGDLFSQSWNVYKEKFLKFMGISLLPVAAMILVALIFGILAFVLLVATGVSKQSLEPSLNTIAAIGIPAIILAILAALVAIAIYIIAQVGLMLMITEEGRQLSIKEALREGKKKAAGYIWVSFVNGILVFLWFILLIIPGIIFSVYYSFSLWVYVCEGKRGYEALKRSKELVSGYWWPVFARYVLLAIGYMAIVLVLIRIIQAANNILSILVTPFFLVYSYLMYKNLVALKGNSEPKTEIIQSQSAQPIQPENQA